MPSAEGRCHETDIPCRAAAWRIRRSGQRRGPGPGEHARPISGTRLEISATGEATRVPDVAIISAGVVTRATSARAALAQNAARMERVRAALKSAGIADRDIQTSNISLNPEYRYVENQPPKLTGYTASNQLQRPLSGYRQERRHPRCFGR